MLFAGLTIPPASAINSVAGSTMPAAGWRQAVPIIYGEVRLGALILNVLPHATDASLYLVQCLWGYAGGGVSAVKLNGDDLPAGSSATHYDGTQSTADSAVVAAFAAQTITYTDTLAGFAYSVLALPVKSFAGRLDVTALVKGRKLYDPRLDSTAGGSGAHRLATPSTWEWSDNPALADADFLYSSTYGCGQAVDWASVDTTADACDSLVGGSEKRRTLNLALTQPASVESVAEALRAYAGCWHVTGASGIRLVPDADGAADATYAHSAGAIAAIAPVVMRDAGSAPTAVEVVYSDTSTTPWSQRSRVAQLGGAGATLPWRLSVVQLPGITRATQAYREAFERLNKLTLGVYSTTVDVFDIGIRHDVGDLVEVTHPIGLTGAKMRVTGVEMTDRGRWRLSLVQHSALAYSDAVVDVNAADVTSPLVDPGPPEDVTALAAVGTVDGGLISWNASTEVEYAYTELRVGASWAAGQPLGGGASGNGTKIASNEFLWASPDIGSHTIWAAHVDVFGVTGAPASTTLSITAGSMSSVSATISGRLLQLDYAATQGTYEVAGYEIRYGSTWAGGMSVGVHAVTRYVREIDWAGDRRWWVAPVDTRGNAGAASSVDITVTAPGAVTSSRAEVVDNNVLLYWSAPSVGSLPIDRYEVRKGATWAGGSVVGSNGNSTFTTVFEQEADTYTYWIAAVDSAGNQGTPASIVATVNQPPDYVLRTSYDEDFSGATLSNLYLDGGKVYGPALLETIQTHFESRSWASVDAQITAGYPLVFQPSGTSGYYERTIDYGSELPPTVIAVTPSVSTLSGAVTSQVQISYKVLVGDAWTDATAGATQVLAPAFRYVKVRITLTGSGGDDLAEIAAVNIKLSSKLKTFSGTKSCLAADSGGTSVGITGEFIDVQSITCTALSTSAYIVVYDFTDQPNPTNFKILVFNTSGTRQDATVSYTLRGF